MESVLEVNNNHNQAPAVRPAPKKQRIGRWTQSQAYLFETLLQRHGKNWKKIHQHMKGRTLSQIRSHGQKHFGKIGAKKMEELQRRAKLLEAYETLQKEKRLQEQMVSKSQSSEERSVQLQVKIQEESPVTIEQSHVQNQQEKLPQINPSEIIKEQSEKQSQQIQRQAPAILPQQTPDFVPYYGNSFLTSLIWANMDYFRAYGIEGFIDDQQFRNKNAVSYQ